jgi:hypothetical protein
MWLLRLGKYSNDLSQASLPAHHKVGDVVSVCRDSSGNLLWTAQHSFLLYFYLGGVPIHVKIESSNCKACRRESLHMQADGAAAWVVCGESLQSRRGES